MWKLLKSGDMAKLLVLTLGLVGPAASAAGPEQITIPGDHVYPESITATADGALINGGLGNGGIYRTAPGSSAAKLWIRPGTNGTMSVLGVLADEGSHTRYACSSDLGTAGVTIPGGKKPVALKLFDLSTGAPKGSIPLPGDRALCNDIAIGPDGAAYVTDSFNPHVLRLAPGSDRFTIWSTDPRFTVAQGAGLDGIAFGSDGNVYVNLYNGNKMFRINVNRDGSAGAVDELRTSRPLDRPDALRRFGTNTLLMIEGGGRLDMITVSGDDAKVDPLKGGYDVPVSVVQIGHTAWVLEGQLDHLFNPKLGPPHAFRIDPVVVP